MCVCVCVHVCVYVHMHAYARVCVCMNKQGFIQREAVREFLPLLPACHQIGSYILDHRVHKYLIYMYMVD